jgi:glutathione S-transferase
LEVEENIIDPSTGLHKSYAFLALNPNGKLPILELGDGTSLWESNAIVNRLCAETDTPLWPKSNQRYDIMRWQFWEGYHWNPACGPFIRHHLFGNPDVDLDAAAQPFRALASVLDGELAETGWLSGDQMTVADITVAAILVYRHACQYPLDGYARIADWMARIDALDAWSEVDPAR